MGVLSDKGLEFLIKEEGCVLSPYKDAVGKMTIGVGHLITKDELSSGRIVIKNIETPWQNGITKQEAKDLLAQDVGRFEEVVTDSLSFEPEQEMFDALVSLCFNIGDGAFKKSSLLKKLNEPGDIDLSVIEPLWLAWCNAGGRPILLKRRQRELDLFYEGLYGIYD